MTRRVQAQRDTFALRVSSWTKTPVGRAGFRTGMGMRGPLPKNLTFRHWPEDFSGDESLPPFLNLPGVTAHLGDDPKPIGQLSWIGGTPDEFREQMRGMDYGLSGPSEPVGSGEGDGDIDWPGTVSDIHVKDEYRRLGIADAMFDHVKRNYRPDLRHSSERTPDGYAWSEHEQSREGKR